MLLFSEAGQSAQPTAGVLIRNLRPSFNLSKIDNIFISPSLAWWLYHISILESSHILTVDI